MLTGHSVQRLPFEADSLKPRPFIGTGLYVARRTMYIKGTVK